MLHGRITEGMGGIACGHSFEAKAPELETLTELCTEPAPEPASDGTADVFASASGSLAPSYMERPKVVTQKASMNSDLEHSDLKGGDGGDGGDGDGSEGPLLTKLLANLMQPAERPEDHVPDCIFWTQNRQSPYGRDAMSIML
eukprot:Skav230130  [mRNA]  locus=scaffold1301:30437:30865:+ [translate_table: standard]